jgi:hypothetical protein
MDTQPLAVVREPLDTDIGLDVVDTRNAKTLIWRPSAGNAISVAGQVNRLYPDRDDAPEHSVLRVEMERICAEALWG